MHICVFGAGVIGLTLAWELAERGFRVTIVDRKSAAGTESSFANGAQLSYSYVAPLASPDTLWKLPGLMLSRSAPIRIRPKLEAEFFRWSIEFLRACTERKVHETTRAQLALAALSRDAMASLVRAVPLEFGLREAGKLVVYRKQSTFSAAKRQVEVQRASGDVSQRVVSAADCLALEPALTIAADNLAGGVFTPSDQVGDCQAFCAALAQRLGDHSNVEFRLDVHIRDLVQSDGVVTAVETSQGRIYADTFVVALGSGASALARRSGFRLPIYPLKGYSLTAQPALGTRSLQLSVTDFDRKIVYAPLMDGQRPVVRVAGIADLVGLDSSIDPQRIATLTRQAAEALDLDIEADLRPWAGLRPTTPDSRPIIGWSPLKNLFLNAGHGALGWTLACGSARLAADLMTNTAPPIESDWFSLARFS